MTTINYTKKEKLSRHAWLSKIRLDTKRNSVVGEWWAVQADIRLGSLGSAWESHAIVFWNFGI